MTFSHYRHKARYYEPKTQNLDTAIPPEDFDEKIRSGYLVGASCADIAKECGVTKSAVTARAMKMAIVHPYMKGRQRRDTKAPGTVRISKYMRGGKGDAENWLSIWSMPEPNSGCWIWTGAENGSGYGLVYEGKACLAHRMSYEVHVGPIPDGLGVLHKCDNRYCVNPEHLFVGTNMDNMIDMQQKSRSWKIHRPEVVSQIVALSRQPLLHREIADVVGVQRQYVSSVLSGKTRKYDVRKANEQQ